MTTDLGVISRELAATAAVCDRDIQGERFRQLKKFGIQSPPDGTGHDHDTITAAFYRQLCDSAFEHGTGTWRHILDEEIHEAYAETEYEKLRAELVQVATVAVAWVADLDRRHRKHLIRTDPLLAFGMTHGGGVKP